MTILFEPSEQIKYLTPLISQNNDLYEGRRRLIDQIDVYYDGLELDKPEQKLARWKRTPFYFYYPKIISSFTSSIFRKPPNTVLPVDDKDVSNIDLLGNSLNEYVSQIPLQVLKQGFCATIVDYSDQLGKPYLILIKPEQFVSIRVGNSKGYPELDQFIYTIDEEIQDVTNEFKIKTIQVHYVWDKINEEVRVRKYRRLKINAEEDTNNFNRRSNKQEYSDELESETFLTQNGKALDKLPIIIHGKEPNNFTIDKSVLQDVSDLNIQIILRVVDQIEVLHLTAVPTPYITGIDPDGDDVPTTIGAQRIWAISEADAKVGMLEFSGESAKAHMDYVEDLRQTMAITGAQILKQQGVSRETATSVLIRTGQETAVITSIVTNVSSQVEEVLKLYFEWLDVPTDEISYKLNADFLSVEMDPNAQIALVKSWMEGAISHESVFLKMKEGELVPANRTFDEELELIKKNPPSFPSKEKDAELSDTMGDGTGSNQEESLKGSNLDTGNSVTNTEK